MESSLAERGPGQPILGIALKIASTLVFTAMATLIKLLSDRYPVGELTFARSAFALVPVLVWAGSRGQLPGAFYTSHIGAHLVRSFAGVIGMFCGFTALSMLPIVDAIAIGYASPLMTVVFAVFLLGETVRMYRWSAVIVGFVGVLIILSDYVVPGASGHERSVAGALIAIAGAVFGAYAATQVRILTRYEGAATIVIIFSTFAALISLATLPFGWVAPSAGDTALMVLAGIFGGIGQVLLTQCYRFGDASTIAPFDYTSMIWTMVVSLAVFGAWPNATILFGTAIVIAAGLFVIWREHRLGIERTRSKRAQTPTTPVT
jgi:drug/metabolite transporter (DMT)-like permease